MKRVAFEVTYPSEALHPLHRRLTRTTVASRMELLAWGPTDDVTTLSWFDAGPETVRELLAAVETASATDLVEADDGTYAFVRQTDYEFDDDLMAVVSASRAVFLPPVTFRGDGTATFEAVGEHGALSEFYGALGELTEVRIERVHDFRRGASPPTLTDRRREAVSAAAAVGYYDVPRTGTVADVAAELDCATSTAGELLRRAESTLVAEFVSRRGRGAATPRGPDRGSEDVRN
ncbi:DNA binding protein [Halogeometricum pallidum JCM 14848]|uniref:DNA binding protein n=1 Tax=Halogeometricum pallidum JCM 14848 TaxID=1227487 RepID=M0DJX1_HALPD|nr:helix-turn-helix domain-containing protein [Halogeometricum pallidum]ELZ35108.1 DNA binding protein [Halogeometricum pallidum JCM 14848]